MRLLLLPLMLFCFFGFASCAVYEQMQRDREAKAHIREEARPVPVPTPELVKPVHNTRLAKKKKVKRKYREPITERLYDRDFYEDVKELDKSIKEILESFPDE